MTIGERIKQRRKDLGITAEELAEKIGVSRATMFRYESKDEGHMKFQVLAAIARGLNTTVAYLAGWEDDVTPTPPDGKDGREIETSQVFESLPEDRKAEALNYLRYLASSGDKK